MKIQNITAKEILDSKGEPTLEVTVTLEDGTQATASVPSGASTGKYEAVELRDKDPNRHEGKGVLKAVDNVNIKLAACLEGKDAYDQAGIDKLMITLDGTTNKAKLGANAIVGVSMAVCRAAAKSQKIELYEYIGRLTGNRYFSLPRPQVLMFEGGKHGGWATDIQEYLLIPQKDQFKNFSAAFGAGEQVFLALKQILSEKRYATSLGFEGGYRPAEIQSNEEVFELISQAITRAGYSVNKQLVLGLDAATSEFFEEGKYLLRSEGGLRLTVQEWSVKLAAWIKKYPLWSLEDIFPQEEWDSWSAFTKQFGGQVQVVGDDLLTTNVTRIQKAIETRAVNAAIIKLNQIGTVWETLEAIKLAKAAGLATIVSHRAGETMDDFAADLCVGAGCPQCKFGGPTKPERRVKYNRLLDIERQLIKQV